jgi:hypothetical protein
MAEKKLSPREQKLIDKLGSPWGRATIDWTGNQDEIRSLARRKLVETWTVEIWGKTELRAKLTAAGERARSRK